MTYLASHLCEWCYENADGLELNWCRRHRRQRPAPQRSTSSSSNNADRHQSSGPLPGTDGCWAKSDLEEFERQSWTYVSWKAKCSDTMKGCSTLFRADSSPDNMVKPVLCFMISVCRIIIRYRVLTCEILPSWFLWSHTSYYSSQTEQSILGQSLPHQSLHWQQTSSQFNRLHFVKIVKRETFFRRFII